MTDKKLIAFHGKQAVKDLYIARMKAHMVADELIQGTGWAKRGAGKYQGCAVGCTVNKYDHFAYETELGMPAAIAQIEDSIFEHLKWEQAKQWPLRFLEVIPVGADLSRVSAQFQYWLMLENLKHEKFWREHDKKKEYTDKVVGAIKQVAELLKKWAETGLIDESAARSAESAAWSAAWSAARSAAWSAENEFYIKISNKLLELLSQAPVMEAKSN